MSGQDAHDRDAVIRQLRTSLQQRAADVEVTPAFGDRVARQRRHRTIANRVALAAATTAVLGIVAVLGAGLLASAQRIRLVDPPVAAPPAASEEPSAAAVAPSGIADLGSALLTPGELPRMGTAGWLRDGRSAQPRPSVELFDPCRPTAYPTDPQRTEVRTIDLVQDIEAEPALIRQNVARYPSVAVAEQAFAGFRRVAEQCTRAEAARAPDSWSTQLLDRTATQLLVRQNPDEGLYVEYAVVVRRGEVVTLVRVAVGETREVDTEARRVVAAVAAALDDAE